MDWYDYELHYKDGNILYMSYNDWMTSGGIRLWKDFNNDYNAYFLYKDKIFIKQRTIDISRIDTHCIYELHDWDPVLRMTECINIRDSIYEIVEKCRYIENMYKLRKLDIA